MLVINNYKSYSKNYILENIIRNYIVVKVLNVLYFYFIVNILKFIGSIFLMICICLLVILIYAVTH